MESSVELSFESVQKENARRGAPPQLTYKADEVESLVSYDEIDPFEAGVAPARLIKTEAYEPTGKIMLKKREPKPSKEEKIVARLTLIESRETSRDQLFRT